MKEMIIIPTPTPETFSNTISYILDLQKRLGLIDHCFSLHLEDSYWIYLNTLALGMIVVIKKYIIRVPYS